MDNTDDRFNRDKTIGKNAEDIFRFLINSTDEFKIVEYGIENHIEILKKHLKDNHDEVSEKIKYMPDFVVINEKNKNVMLIEVKRTSFIDKRKSDKLIFGFQKNLIEKYIKYWGEAKLFIVHQQEPYFYIIDLKDINVKEHKLEGDRYVSIGNLLDSKRPMNYWNFKDIKKGIKEIFPNLRDEIIQQAITMIMIYKAEEKSQEEIELEKEFLS